uniref:Uncharacterized protein n=1 Tax=Daphnia galeata TaxID=27404 RepID=A0A8J2RI34_9CRUS|nr:unnamed protein product [Daphnia galeata]
MGISQDDLTKQVEEAKQELLANFEAKLKELNAFREVTQKELDLTRKKLIKMESIVDDLMTTKLNATCHDCKVIKENLRIELRATSINLNTTRTELINAKSDVADLKTKLNDRTSEIVDIGKMPSSCFDLERMGHKLSGFFSVKGSKKMEIISCDFNPNKNGIDVF